RDGQVVWVKEDANLIRDPDGNPLYWQGLLLDITQEKANEAALQRQVEELAVLHAAALAASNALDVDKLIGQVTNIIGDTLYPDNFGILLVEGKTNTIKPHSSYRGTSAENLSRSLPITQGITGEVARARKPIRLGNVTRRSEYYEVTQGVQSELCVPIISRGEVIGVINTESRKPDAYSERDERLLTTLAHTLATATDKLRSFAEARQRATELEALYQASRSLALSLEPEIIARNLITTMDEMLGYEFASVYLLDDRNQMLMPLAISQKALDPEHQQLDKASFLKEKIPVGVGMIGWVAQHGQPIRAGDVTNDERYLGVLKNIKSELCVPLIARGKSIGVLDIESTEPNAYTERDENLLAALANSAAITFENARLYKSELERREQAETLRTATASLSTALDIPTLYELILDSASKLVPYDSALIEAVKRGCLETVAQRGQAGGHSSIGGKKPWEPDRWGDWKDIAAGQYKPIISSNPGYEDDVSEHHDSGHRENSMTMPLAAGEQVFGLIHLHSHRPGFFTEEHAGLIQTFAAQAGIAIEKAQLYQDAVRAAERRAVLHRISQDIVRVTQDSEQIYLAIHEATEKLMRCDVFVLSLRDEKRDENIPVYIVELGNRYYPQGSPANKGLTAAVINEGRSIILKNEAEIGQRDVLHFGSPRHVQSVVAVPL
ncbi:MAG TPA: GAF domain-containing protein, partial [Anaerolineales bacterium]